MNRQLPQIDIRGWGVLGELSLDGRVRAVRGTLGMVRALRARGIERVLLPVANIAEAQAVGDIQICGVDDLRQAAQVLLGDDPGVPDAPELPQADVDPGLDLGDVIGHTQLKRALALAVAGGHNVLLVGSPGTGKSFLARRVPSLLPPLAHEHVLEVTQIQSAAGLDRGRGLVSTPPFRAPHHTVSWAGLVGGGAVPRPGEITLAHRGVLFLDELPEFSRRSLEALREPLEEGHVTITRARATLQFPASFLLMAAMNPCPCGNHLHPRRVCHCTPARVRHYLEKVSGPLLDRIDLRLEVHTPPLAGLFDAPEAPTGTSAEYRALIDVARRFQAERGRPDGNRHLQWRTRRDWAPLSQSASELLVDTAGDLELSTRALTRILRLARTIADAATSERIEEQHLLESIHYHSFGGGDSYFNLLHSL